jgi:hypothetical protein
MKLHGHIKEIGLDIINSYEKRVKLVKVLINEAARRMDEYCKEQEEMIGQLRGNLARSEGLRKRDFDSLMESVLSRRREREKETRETLERLWREEGGMIDTLRGIFTDGNVDFERVKGVILSRHRDREREVARLLMKLHLEQEELSAALKGLLSKGGKIKINDFKEIIRAVRMRHDKGGEGIDRLLEEFCKVRQEVTVQWQGLFSVYDRMPSIGQSTPPSP